MNGNTPSFDRWQFDGHTARPVGHYDARDENRLGLSWDDYRRMGQQSHAPRNRPVPSWTLSNEKVRAVIFARLKQYVGGHPGATMWELAKLAEKKRDALAKKLLPRLNDYQRSLIEAHARATKNGIAGLWVRLLYEKYRLGMRCTDISENMQGAISPWSVRGHLQRLNEIARRLFPEDCLPRTKHYGKKKQYRDGHHPNRKLDPASVVCRGRGRPPKPAAPQKLCECGCGEMANAGKRFIRGHYLARIEPRGKRGHACKIDYARALEMRKAGLPVEFIAAEFGVKKCSVYNVWRKQGVRLRRVTQVWIS